MLLRFVYKYFSLFFFLKYNVKSHPGQYQKYINIENIKMKLPVALFEKKGYEIVFVSKAKSQAKDYQHSCMLLA